MEVTVFYNQILEVTSLRSQSLGLVYTQERKCEYEETEILGNNLGTI